MQRIKLKPIPIDFNTGSEYVYVQGTFELSMLGFSIYPVEGNPGQKILFKKSKGDFIDISVNGNKNIYKILKIFKWSNGARTYLLEFIWNPNWRD